MVGFELKNWDNASFPVTIGRSGVLGLEVLLYNCQPLDLWSTGVRSLLRSVGLWPVYVKKSKGGEFTG